MIVLLLFQNLSYLKPKLTCTLMFTKAMSPSSGSIQSAHAVNILDCAILCMMPYTPVPQWSKLRILKVKHYMIWKSVDLKNMFPLASMPSSVLSQPPSEMCCSMPNKLGESCCVGVTVWSTVSWEKTLLNHLSASVYLFLGRCDDIVSAGGIDLEVIEYLPHWKVRCI